MILQLGVRVVDRVAHEDTVTWNGVGSISDSHILMKLNIYCHVCC